MASFSDDGPGPLRVEFLAPTALDEAGRRWRELEADAGPVPVMRSWVWSSAWVRAFGPEVACRFAFVVDPRGRTVGATLVTAGQTRRGPVPLDVRWLGTGDLPEGAEAFPDANGPVALPGHESPVLRALIAALADEGGWDELRLTGALDDDARRFATTWPASRVRAQRLASPLHDLRRQPVDGDVTASLRRSHRRNARRTLRAFQRTGEVTVDWAETPAEGLAMLDELVRLHQVRWNADGRPGAFARPEVLAFHRELVERLVADGRVALSRVRCDGRTIATTYGFVDGGHLRSYQTGLAPAGGGRLRPGALGDLLTMAEARRRGLETYDFLPGGVDYKRTLSTGEGRRWRVALRGRRPRLAVVDALAGAREVLRRVRGRPAPAEAGWDGAEELVLRTTEGPASAGPSGAASPAGRRRGGAT
ncbi:GNAT family N-acetyltransferase [Patulibacter minatonensis]|uniref:GNAT family N-acetyltransferase n=1 Tax=Patulibacter minatonensis TaxID=298163 RepID=UPI00047D4D0C|nr:GNAT family N-acetyltransferase [Patulibacter minatonensis]